MSLRTFSIWKENVEKNFVGARKIFFCFQVSPFEKEKNCVKRIKFDEKEERKSFCRSAWKKQGFFLFWTSSSEIFGAFFCWSKCREKRGSKLEKKILFFSFEKFVKRILFVVRSFDWKSRKIRKLDFLPFGFSTMENIRRRNLVDSLRQINRKKIFRIWSSFVFHLETSLAWWSRHRCFFFSNQAVEKENIFFLFDVKD